MRGTPLHPFTTLMADTIRAHGLAWARAYYAKRLPRWELDFFMSTSEVRDAVLAAQA